MKFTKLAFFCIFLISSCTCKKGAIDPYQMKPPYKLINLFSQKIKPETGLILTCYGYNNNLPKNYQYTHEIANFTADYKLLRHKNDEFSLDYARNLIVFLTENLLQDINSNLEITPYLDVYPFTNDLINISIHFKDENQIDLGQGIAFVYFSRGKIKYESYKIREYTGHYPAAGKHFIVHEETYAEALDIVKKQGSLKYLK